jgi:hypothetical protein
MQLCRHSPIDRALKSFLNIIGLTFPSCYRQLKTPQILKTTLQFAPVLMRIHGMHFGFENRYDQVYKKTHGRKTSSQAN